MVLQPIQGQRPLDPPKIKIVGPKNLQVAQLIPHAKLMVSLKLASVASSTDTLKVLSAVRITNSQSPDEPRWHDVVHMAPNPSLLEIHAARFDLTLPP